MLTEFLSFMLSRIFSKLVFSALFNEGAASLFTSKLKSSPIGINWAHLPIKIRHVFLWKFFLNLNLQWKKNYVKTAIVGATSITWRLISERSIESSRELQVSIKQSCSRWWEISVKTSTMSLTKRDETWRTYDNGSSLTWIPNFSFECYKLILSKLSIL